MTLRGAHSATLEPPNGGSLREDLGSALAAVRRPLAAIVESACGTAPEPHALADRFGVYRSLGWQVWNLLYLDDPVVAVRHLPPVRSMRVWKDAVAKRDGTARPSCWRSSTRRSSPSTACSTHTRRIGTCSTC